MRIKKFSLDPIEYQNHRNEEDFNKELFGAVHVETYTKDEGRFGGDRTLKVFAFYPDEKPHNQAFNWIKRMLHLFTS
jgi:hypothetical protein